MIGVQQIDRVVEVVEEALKGKSHVFYSILIVSISKFKKST